MLFQSIIHSKLTYLHRVLVPTPVQIEEIDKLTRSALWTKSFKGHEYGRTKISKKKLEAPLVAGGLGIPPASSLVFRSQINSALANWKYFVFNPSATWNKLHNLDHRGTKLIHTGSKKLPRNSAFLKKTWAGIWCDHRNPGWGSRFQGVPTWKMEQNFAHRIQVWKHI